MKALIFVLSNADLLAPLLEEFNSKGIKGCTIFDSNGMGREMAKRNDDFSIMFGSLRKLLNPSLEKTKTLLLVLEESRVNCAVTSIEKIAGDLNEPDKGILFTFPIEIVKGMKL